VSGVLFVAGLGRCGTTAVMTMLRAGGMPVAGSAPDFECAEMYPFDAFNESVPSEYDIPPMAPTIWLNSQAGRAVKYIDPSMIRISADAAVAGSIFLTRDPHQQAYSQMKLLRGMFPNAMSKAPAGAVLRMAAGIERDAATSLQQLQARGPVLELTFEQLITDPRGTAVAIADFVLNLFEISIDVAAMTAVVHQRKPECLPDLVVELTAIQRAEAAEASIRG